MSGVIPGSGFLMNSAFEIESALKPLLSDV